MMKKRGKHALWTGGFLLVLFVVWTGMVQTIDVQSIGPMATEVGFGGVNGWVHRLFGVHMMLYTITDWLGLVPIFVCFIFAVIGLVQTVKRRNLLMVDFDLILLGLYYLVVAFGYLIFEMFPVNYRPIPVEGCLEASYPSSTTLLVLSVMPTLTFQVRRRLKNGIPQKIIVLLSGCFSMFMVVGRLISGVHWVTDIIGAVWLSAGLFCMYRGAVILCCKET